MMPTYKETTPGAVKPYAGNDTARGLLSALLRKFKGTDKVASLAAWAVDRAVSRRDENL